MNILFLIGRIILGGYFLRAAFQHFQQLNELTEYAKVKGTPAPKLAVAASGIVLLFGGLSILLGIATNAGILLLVLFLLAASFLIHSYWKDTNPEMRQIDSINFGKNIALAGALLVILFLPHPWPWSFHIGS